MRQQKTCCMMIAVVCLLFYAGTASGSMEVATGFYHTVGLKSDGTVNAVGNNYRGPCNVFTWDLDEIATLVELSSFKAQPLSGTVVLRWETSSELDTAGFNLFRAEVEGGPYAKINDALIPSESSAMEGRIV